MTLIGQTPSPTIAVATEPRSATVMDAASLADLKSMATNGEIPLVDIDGALRGGDGRQQQVVLAAVRQMRGAAQRGAVSGDRGINDTLHWIEQQSPFAFAHSTLTQGVA